KRECRWHSLFYFSGAEEKLFHLSITPRLTPAPVSLFQGLEDQERGIRVDKGALELVFCRSLPFSGHPEPVEGSQSYTLKLSLTYCEAFDITRLPPSRNDGNVVLWSEISLFFRQSFTFLLSCRACRGISELQCWNYP